MSDPRAYARTNPSYRPLAVRVISFVCGGIAIFVLLHLAFLLLGANPSNPLVELVTAIADFFAWPFHNIFYMKDDINLQNILNYGLAALAYVLVGVGVGTLFRRHD
ncbi:MAG TPA: hypothetical protein VE172_19830 [Stackebrandtia sp.]|jgi:hypothetical protein|uniref:hypothetical protein n=1 Tax=Stackebrandtia sp. TaxID=2023065 RepID=UPI002D47CD85|nr:hypothetical protein [Stackebrandtia sp.]HZE41055.1 hypothetical protein [Stackebrandtia sp.]